mgnify:CR=1 FL=1
MHGTKKSKLHLLQSQEDDLHGVEEGSQAGEDRPDAAEENEHEKFPASQPCAFAWSCSGYRWLAVQGLLDQGGHEEQAAPEWWRSGRCSISNAAYER